MDQTFEESSADHAKELEDIQVSVHFSLTRECDQLERKKDEMKREIERLADVIHTYNDQVILRLEHYIRIDNLVKERQNELNVLEQQKSECLLKIRKKDPHARSLPRSPLCIQVMHAAVTRGILKMQRQIKR